MRGSRTVVGGHEDDRRHAFSSDSLNNGKTVGPGHRHVETPNPHGKQPVLAATLTRKIMIPSSAIFANEPSFVIRLAAFHDLVVQYK